MNRGLIEDEGSRNPMSLGELEERMRGWLEAGDWNIKLLELEGETAGYVLYRVGREEHFPERPQVYLRQFYVLPEYRKQGLGRAAIGMLMVGYFPPGSSIILDVLANNPVGIAFWHSLGFKDYALTLERRP